VIFRDRASACIGDRLEAVATSTDTRGEDSENTQPFSSGYAIDRLLQKADSLSRNLLDSSPHHLGMTTLADRVRRRVETL
jgi:hypothetical protein